MALVKKIRLTLDDYTAFNFFHLRARLIAVPVVLVLAAPAAMIVIDIINYGSIQFVSLIAVLIIAMLLAGMLTLVNIGSLWRAARKQYESSKEMQAENEIAVDEVGARESGEYGSSVVSWLDVFKAAEGPSAYYIFFSRLQAFVIPKRLLTPEEEAALRTLLLQHLPPEKIKLKKRS